jgi:hypothetical protein
MVATLPWNVAADDGAFGAVADAMGLEGGAAALPAAFGALMGRTGLRVSLAGEFDGVTPHELAGQMRRPENEAMLRANRRPVGDDDIEAFARSVLSA